MRFISPNDGHRLDKAITFLAEKYSQTGDNPKPVIFHSLNVAFYLLDYGYDGDLIEAAILHDLLEDSAVTKDDISLVFGDKTAATVDALSFRVSIEDKEKRYQEMFARINQAGRGALIIKCADIYANSFYIRLVDDKEKQKFLINKISYFLNLSKEKIGREPVWSDLAKQEVEENKRWAGLAL